MKSHYLLPHELYVQIIYHILTGRRILNRSTPRDLKHFGNLENEYFLKSPIFYMENEFVIALFYLNLEHCITNTDDRYQKMCKEIFSIYETRFKIIRFFW